MPSQLVCRPERHLPVAVLTVSGTLDRTTAGALDAAVRRSLAGQPDRVLLDFTRVRLGDPAATAVLARQFPAVPIVVCGADERTRAALAADPRCAGLRLADDYRQSLTEAEEQSTSDDVRVRLRPVPEACRQVRALVAQTCSAWQRSDVTPVAALVATELVANVVRHARTTMDFTLRLRDGRVILSVRDHSRLMPRTLDPGTTDAGGRGLHLIGDLADAWGVLPVTDGKVVWSQLTAESVR